MAAAPHVCIVDDDPEIRRLLGSYLGDQGFHVTMAASVRDFDERMPGERIDIVILDVVLRDGSGLDLCRKLQRQDPQLRLIFLSRLKEEVDRIIGLEVGADDYIAKPCNPRELLARIRALLRRKMPTPTVDIKPRSGFRIAGFLVDLEERSVTDASRHTVNLTGAEFDLLHVFLDRPGRVLSRNQLLELTRGRASGPYDRSIDVLLSRLRKKLGQAAPTEFFKTVRNGGYQFAARVERETFA